MSDVTNPEQKVEERGEVTGFADLATGRAGRALSVVAERFAVGPLKWVASLSPLAFFVTWEYVWHYQSHALVDDQPILFLAMVTAIALVGSAVVFGHLHLLERAHRLLRSQNQELSARTVALEALYELGTRLSASHEVAAIKETAVQRARQLLGADTAGLALLDETRSVVHWELVVGTHGESPKSFETKLGECIGGEVIQSGEPLIVEDADPQGGYMPATRRLLAVENLRGALVVPVRIAGKPVGALMAGHRSAYSFQLNHLKLLLGLANQLAVAINNARLYERLSALSALEERERLAREMHDGLAQLLGHVTARAAAAREMLRQGKPEGAAEHVDRLREVAQDAYTEVRQSILGLRTRPEQGSGFLETLRAYLSRFGDQERIAVQLESSTEDVDLVGASPEVEVQALRIVQEALSNVRKHARANHAWVSVAGENGGVNIDVRDDGEGFDLQKARSQVNHFGLETMRERAEGVGGRFSIESQPGRGTVVNIWLPTRNGGAT